MCILRSDSQICMLDGSGVGLEIISSQNLASEPLGEAPPDGAFAEVW